MWAEGKMNEVLALLGRRRSVAPHLLGGPGPSREEIDRILALATRVPDHGKLAPWRFLVITGKARTEIGEAIAAAFQADEPGAGEERVETERRRLARAPVVIAVVARARAHVKIPEWEQMLSAGAVCMNLVIAANAMGYATSWLTEWLAFDRRVLDRLGLAPEEKIAGFIHIGQALQEPSDRPRPDLTEIVTYL
jgi:nitroreductase